jgi:uncharacterized protein YbjT (DUF2867 family)
MNYVITGAAGNVARPLALQLLAAGKSVTVTGRNKKNLEPLVRAGAKAAIGQVEDVSFLKMAFAGADAVFTLAPTDIFATDLKTQHEKFGNNYAEAITANNIKYVVNLSSIGAHLGEGAGPVSAIHYTEQALNRLNTVHLCTLRATFFYQNLLNMIGMIRHMNIIGGNFSFDAGKFPVTHTGDVAATAADELLSLNFKGHSVRYVASDETGTDEIAAVLGKAIGKPQLKWIKFSYEQVVQSLRQAGFPEKNAREYANLYNAMDKGLVTQDYWKNRPQHFGKTKLEDFARLFAGIYNKEQQAITQ